MLNQHLNSIGLRAANRLVLLGFEMAQASQASSCSLTCYVEFPYFPSGGTKGSHSRNTSVFQMGGSIGLFPWQNCSQHPVTLSVPIRACMRKQWQAPSSSSTSLRDFSSTNPELAELWLLVMLSKRRLGSTVISPTYSFPGRNRAPLVYKKAHEHTPWLQNGPLKCSKLWKQL